MGGFRITLNLLRVLQVLYQHPETERYGLELSQASGVKDGALYPILRKLEAAGLLVARWEELDEKAAGRRRRCYYRLTAQGTDFARAQLRAAPSLSD